MTARDLGPRISFPLYLAAFFVFIEALSRLDAQVLSVFCVTSVVLTAIPQGRFYSPVRKMKL